MIGTNIANMSIIIAEPTGCCIACAIANLYNAGCTGKMATYANAITIMKPTIVNNSVFAFCGFKFCIASL